MLWTLALGVLVLSQLAESETSSEENKTLQMEHMNLNESFPNEDVSSGLLTGTGEPEPLHLKSLDDEDLYNKMTEGAQFMFSNYSSILGDLVNLKINDSSTESESASGTEKSKDKYQSRQFTDQSKDSFLKNYAEPSRPLPASQKAKQYYDRLTSEIKKSADNYQNNQFNDELKDSFFKTYVSPPRPLPTSQKVKEHDLDFLLQKNISDAYNPTRTKKQNILSKEQEHITNEKPPRNLINPVLKLEDKTVKDAFMNRVNGLLEKSRKSQKRFGDMKRNAPTYIEPQRTSSRDISELSSNQQLLSRGIPSSLELSGQANTGFEKIYNYHPNFDLGAGNNGGFDEDGSSKQFGLGNQKIIKISGKEKYEVIDPESSEVRNQGEGIRKVTIVKEKTLHSVSREEEQESLNIQKNPNNGPPIAKNVATIPQLKSRNVPNYKNHENIEKREEIIVLVGGSHEPDKSHEPEVGNIGYLDDSHNNIQPHLKSGNQFKTVDTVKPGQSSESSYKVQYNNHGNGISSSYFVSDHPKTSQNSHVSADRTNNRYTFPPVQMNPKPARGTHTIIVPEQVPTKFESPPSYIKYEQNLDQNNKQNYGNTPETKHQDENQYEVLENIDPNQIYIDENTGQVIKFVTEEEATKLYADKPVNSEDQGNDHAAVRYQKNTGQNYPHSNPDGSSGTYGPTSEKQFHKNFESNLDNTKYNNLDNVHTSVHSPETKVRKNIQYNGHVISQENTRSHVPPKGITENSNLHSYPLEGNHDIQENQGNQIRSYNEGKGNEYIVLCPGNHEHANDQGNYGNNDNFESSGHSISNSGNIHEHNHNNFKGTSDANEGYGGDNGQTSNGQNPDHKGIYTNGNLGNQRYGSNQGNTGQFKGTENGFNQSPDHVVLYEPQVDGKSFENGHVQIPISKGNANYATFPQKTPSVQSSYFSMGRNKGTGYENSRPRNQNQYYREHMKPQNSLKGTGQNQNEGLRFVSFQNNENFRVSLQNLYGGAFSVGKSPGSTKMATPNFQKTGYNKEGVVFMPGKQLNFRGPLIHGQVKGPGGLNAPQSSYKGPMQNFNGNNFNSGHDFRNSGKFAGELSFDISGGGHGQHGSYKPNGMAHSAPNVNSQSNSHHEPQGGYGGLNNEHQEPEYVLVEMDDGTYVSKRINGNPFLLQNGNNFKGKNNGISYMEGAEPYIDKGATIYPTKYSNMGYVARGGNGRTFSTPRFATAEIHMTGPILSQLPVSQPKSVMGNLHFGLQINKRSGPAKTLQYFITSRSDIGKTGNLT